MQKKRRNHVGTGARKRELLETGNIENLTIQCTALYQETTRSSPQQGDLKLSGPPSDQGAGYGARTRDRSVPADLRADSLATEPLTPHNYE
ncbi:hypothetical protein PoB_005605400 [Plakobranchus ocellatus]|uniref:Uncharacterized protein n=1 Tax=Plakobranchus ocellatus TaxID=259542 RepID=A0AAV4CFJ8_9GAST|nr:hypothetical protein PoB_005605400 [Plakobranchus ocellatus]